MSYEQPLQPGEFSGDPQVPWEQQRFPYPPPSTYPPGDPHVPPGWPQLYDAPPRKHWKWIVPVAVAAAAIVGLVSYLIVRDPHPEDASTAGRHIALPAAVDGFTRLSGYDTGLVKDRFATSAAQFGATGEQLTSSIIVGAYARSATAREPQMIFIAFPLRSVPALADEVRRRGVGGAVREFVDSANTAGGTVRNVDAGSLGGAMRCLDTTQNTGQLIGLCGWGDRSFVAMTLMPGPSSSIVESASRHLREEAEH